jgi:hypothetical protein
MRIAALGMVLALSMGCYTVQLKPIPEVAGRPLGETATIDVPGESASYVYDVRSFAAGVGNRWRIEVGDALVKYAEAYLRPVFPEGDDLRIHITVEGFDVRGFESHIEGRFTVSRGSEIVFNEKYHGQGVGHFAQTAWGGAFAMKSSMRKTTDEALRSLFEQFLADVQKEGALPLAPREIGTK